MGFKEYLKKFKKTYSGKRDVEIVAKINWTKMTKTQKAKHAAKNPSRKISRRGSRTEIIYYRQPQNPWLFYDRRSRSKAKTVAPIPAPKYPVINPQHKVKKWPTVHTTNYQPNYQPTPSINAWNCTGRKNETSCEMSDKCFWTGNSCLTR